MLRPLSDVAARGPVAYATPVPVPNEFRMSRGPSIPVKVVRRRSTSDTKRSKGGRRDRSSNASRDLGSLPKDLHLNYISHPPRLHNGVDASAGAPSAAGVCPYSAHAEE